MADEYDQYDEEQSMEEEWEELLEDEESELL